MHGGEEVKRLLFVLILSGSAMAQLTAPLFTQGDAVTLPDSSYSIPASGTYPYNFVSLGVIPTTTISSAVVPITDANSGLGARTAAQAAVTRCLTKDGTTPTSSPAGTCSHGTSITGGATFTTTGTVTLKAISTQSGQTDSAVSTITITISPFWPVAGTYAYAVAPVLTGNDGGNVIYTTNGSTPTASGTCTATNGTAVANGTAIPGLSTGTTTVKFIPCSGGTSGSVQAATYVVRAHQNWFVRAGGGIRGSQCDGTLDVDLAGSTGGHCAFNDYRYMWDDDLRGGGLGAWIIAGGDTVVVRGCTALATQSNPANPTCRIGWDQNNGGAGNSFCFAVGNQGCTSPPIPVGDATHHTIIEGGCAFDGNCNPVNSYPYTSNLAQIFAGFGLQYSFNLQNTAYVDIKGIELTTHNGVCSHGYAFGYPHACNTSTPEDFADNGFFTNNFSSNITFTDVYEHGFNSSGFFGPIGGPITTTRVTQNFNGFAGWNFNDNVNTPNWPTATVTESRVWREGNGCTEEYPIVDTNFPALGCWDTNSGGFGDAISGQDSNIISYIADHLTTIYNTKDGTMGPHFAYGTLQVTNSYWYANMGQQWKWGGQLNSTSLFQNNEVVGSCVRMATAIPGARQSFNQSTGLGGSYLTGFCRAGGNIVDFLAQLGSSSNWINNTFVMTGQDGIQMDCGPAGGGFTNCGSVPNIFKNNIYLGYTNPAFGIAPTIFDVNAGSNNNPTNSFAVEIGMNGITGCGTNGIQCTSPLLQSQPATPWPGAESNFDNFNFNLTSSSPGITTGTTPCVTTDFAGNTQTSPCTIGARIFASGAPTLVSIAVTPSPGSVVVASTLSMTCTATFSDSSTSACSSPVWTDTNTHSSINSTTGVVTGASAGADTVTATIGAISGNATVNVSAPTAPAVQIVNIKLSGGGITIP